MRSVASDLMLLILILLRRCPSNPWRFQNTTLFVRIDSFLERCHDILDLMQTILQFNKLDRVEIGGTKGKLLSSNVQQIFADFNQVNRCFVIAVGACGF